MRSLVVIFLSAELGGLLAITNGHLALGLMTVLIGSQAAARHDDGYKRMERDGNTTDG